MGEHGPHAKEQDQDQGKEPIRTSTSATRETDPRQKRERPRREAKKRPREQEAHAAIRHDLDLELDTRPDTEQRGTPRRGAGGWAGLVVVVVQPWGRHSKTTCHCGQPAERRGPPSVGSAGPLGPERTTDGGAGRGAGVNGLD